MSIIATYSLLFWVCCLTQHYQGIEADPHVKFNWIRYTYYYYGLQVKKELVKSILAISRSKDLSTWFDLLEKRQIDIPTRQCRSKYSKQSLRSSEFSKHRLTAVSEDDLQKYKVPMRWRDRCVAYFALYQTCLRRQSVNSSVDCHHDKHVWEECEIMDLNRRKQELEELKEKMRLEA